MGTGAVSGLLISAMVTSVMPKQYESEAVITVDHYRLRNGANSGSVIIGEAASEAVWDEQTMSRFYAAEFDRLKSRESLAKLIESLSLTRRWNVDKEEAIRILKEIIVIGNIRESDWISIRVRHPNKEDARDIAGAVVASCQDYWQPIAKKNEDATIVALDQAIKDQEDKVEEQCKLFDSFLSSDNIVCKRDADMVLAYAAGLDLPDNTVRDLLSEYLEARKNLARLQTGGFGDDHPDLAEAKKELRTLKDRIDGEFEKLRAYWPTRLNFRSVRADGSEESEMKVHDESEKRGLGEQELTDECRIVELEKDYRTNLELLDRLKVIAANASVRIPTPVLEIHEPPKLADTPVSPNVTLNLVLGTVAGFILFPIAGLLVMGVKRLARGNPQ